MPDAQSAPAMRRVCVCTIYAAATRSLPHAAALEINPGHGDDAAVANGPPAVSTAATIHRPPAMPTISSFYGILIRIYFFDAEQHHMPHIHAQYQGHQAQFDIASGDLLAGALPRSQTRLVQAWI